MRDHDDDDSTMVKVVGDHDDDIRAADYLKIIENSDGWTSCVRVLR